MTTSIELSVAKETKHHDTTDCAPQAALQLYGSPLRK
jgi:hypothetical protein